MRSEDRLALISAFGCAGFLCAAALIVFGGTRELQHVNATDLLLFIVSGPSAAVGGAICIGLFGHSGGRGWFYAGVGAICSTLLGAMLGGTIVAPVLGALFAPLVLFGNLVIYPAAGLVWFVSMAIVHLYAMNLRAYGKSTT